MSFCSFNRTNSIRDIEEGERLVEVQDGESSPVEAVQYYSII